MNELTEIGPVGWTKFALYGFLLLGIYFSAFSWLVTQDWEREAYSYCWLIPPVVIFLIWKRLPVLISLPSKASSMGLIPVSLGIVLFWLGELSGEFFTLYISFWLALVGICWLHFGWQKLKHIGFALIFMLTMFPIPNFINTRIMLQLQMISSQLGVSIIQLWGLPAYREGNIIDLSFTQLQVVDACSGLHSLISLMVLCLLLVYFFKDHMWKRAVLLISSIPLAIVANSMRIALTGILYKYFGAEAAEGFFHGFSGLLIFVFCIPFLIIEMKILEKLPPIRTKSASVLKETKRSQQAVAIRAKTNRRASNHGLLLQPVFIVAIILLGATLAFSHVINFREKIPGKQSLALFPLKVGEWSADRHLAMAQHYIDSLDLSEYVIIDYQNLDGKKIDFYVAYYESQSKGKSIHSPATCLPGSGWKFEQSGAVKISGVPGNHGPMEVNRAVMQLGQEKRITYYWFAGRGRVLNNAYQLKIFNFWDALTKHRTDGALVRLITTVYDDEDLQHAEKRLKNFTRDIVPVLNEYVPGKDISPRRVD